MWIKEQVDEKRNTVIVIFDRKHKLQKTASTDMLVLPNVNYKKKNRKFIMRKSFLLSTNKANNKITEHRAIFQRERQNS